MPASSFGGYFLLEIPGALIVERWSARRWIARIMISWGLMTVLMAAIHTAHQFYISYASWWAAAEAGFLPGGHCLFNTLVPLRRPSQGGGFLFTPPIHSRTLLARLWRECFSDYHGWA